MLKEISVSWFLYDQLCWFTSAFATSFAKATEVKKSYGRQYNFRYSDKGKPKSYIV